MFKNNNKVLISPSIFASDILNLGSEIKKINKTSCERIHVDIMDGEFVPNISLPMNIVKVLNEKSNKYLDVHLMVTNPLNFIKNIGKDIPRGMITIHIESENVIESLKAIKKLKLETGITIKPGTDIEILLKFLKQNHKLIDNVLVMGVEPGFSGQKFKKNTIKKIKLIRDFISNLDKNISIEVDGGVTPNNSKLLKEAGANILVAGASIFSESNYKKAVKKLR